MNQTRRAALITIAAAAAGAAQAEAQTPEVLNPDERHWMTVLADVMIPRTDTPGASDAGVPAFIERRLAGNDRLADRVRGGLKHLDGAAEATFGTAFLKLSADQQLALIVDRELDAGPLGALLKTFKGLVVDGYYTSKEGLTEELGWHGNTFLPEFKGCTHPEHQS